jgi:hypothetical protein
MKIIFIILTALFISGCKNTVADQEVRVEINGANEFDPKGSITVREVYAMIEIGDGFTATLAKGWFGDSVSGDIVFVEFSVQYRIKDGSLVAFRKSIATNDLPNDFFNIPINKIVSVVDDTIVFTAGKVKITSDKPQGHSLI